MVSPDSRSIDLESQRFVDAANAENERNTFDGDEAFESRKRPSIDIDDDDDDGNEKEKSSPTEPKKRKQYADCWEHFIVVTKTDSK
ncbi:unnamed protein product [Cochlearia groenlandica]